MPTGLAWGIDEANGLWSMGQLIFNMGPEWKEVHILPVMATTQSNIFFAFENPTCKYYTVYYCIIL
jgi:hypothetical protein